MLDYLGKERFHTSSKPVIYCYGKILDEDRESAIVFNPDLRVRMYGRAGNLLAEDVLRDSGSPVHRKHFMEKRDFGRLIVAYLPSLRNGDVILRVARLEGEKEIVLYELTGLNSLENLQYQERWKNPYGYRLYWVAPADLYCHL